ncbi:hypothetical protein ISS42_02970 [Candidatus Shapirobacteria bacterium]|nr:hypothetical protein [Candidatus Shapirobacteria bacterium]
MATRKITDIQLIKTLKDLNKPFYSVADLEKVLDLERESLYVLLNRLVKKGVLVKLKKGVYQPAFQSPDLKKVANELYYPSYLSFESALSIYGIINQVPYVLTFATSRRSKKIELANTPVEYRQIKKDYFFGFQLKNGFYLAEAEKALLDQLYLISKGQVEKNTSEWSLLNLDQKKLIKYSQIFPQTVQGAAKKLLARLGKPVVTLES